MDRRRFLALSSTALSAGSASRAKAQPSLQASEAAVLPQSFYPQQQQYRISYTTDTRGGWEGDPFRGFREAREVGFRYVEVFGSSFCAPPARMEKALAQPTLRPLKVWPDGYVYIARKQPAQRAYYYPNDWESLQHRIYEIGVNFTAITGGALGEPANFADPSMRQAVVQNHFNMARFSRRFGCDHQKTNTGSRKPGGSTVEDLKNICLTLDLLGKRIKEELGMKFGPHPHLGSQIQNQNEVEYVMENTNPDYVGLILDTGHFSMAGMDPIAMAHRYGSRVIEYHLKDVRREDRGGTKNVPTPARTEDQMNAPYFYPLGEGGVDFPALMAFLNATSWKGHLTVELDASPWRPPKESARITANYLQETLKLGL